MTRALVGFLAAALLLLSGCGGPQVTFNKRYQFSKLKRVAVSRFSGSGGEAASDFLAQSLLGSGADVVERARLEAVLNEQRLAASGALDPSTVKRIGKLLGVDAIFVGSVSLYSPPQSYLVYTGPNSINIQQAQPVGSGATFSSEPAFGAPGANILTSSAQVALSARLVDVETGSIVWSAHQSYEGFDLDSAMSSIADSFAHSLANVWR